ncbi:MAG: cob(I)yrinic acid a,c-diamide adenosyltransferase [Actinobacteria bacterium]|nr:cob(I)yrinic acid a,c-diamide adenosyltransferase [Actinomycetota bacterium]
MQIYTRKGDDGTTGLYFGGRVAKDSARPAAYGDVDETQAAIGLARAHANALGADGAAELDVLLIGIQRDLWIVMADLATGEDNRDKLVDGQTRVTAAMISALEVLIDSTEARFEPPTEFVVPGGDVVSAALDVARTVCRRAERSTVSIGDSDSLATSYLNRLSDLLWMLARWQEGSALAVRSLPNAPSPRTFEGDQ